MGFNDGFSTQGVPFVTGSADGQVLTWDDVIKTWVPGAGIGSVSTAVSTSNGIIGDGSPSDPVRLDSSITVDTLTVNGTASIAHLDTIYQQSLIVGDKYITILSGANDHNTANNSGILWGSGSSEMPAGDQGSIAYVLYRSGSDALNIFPGLVVSGNLDVVSGSITERSLPTLSASHVLYVSEDGLDTHSGSFNRPFKTIQAAIDYASSFYSNHDEKVQIKVLAGSYTGFNVNRKNIFFNTEQGNQSQRTVTITSPVKISANGSDKYVTVYGFDGFLFTPGLNVNEPAFHVQGTGSSLVYVQNSQLYTNTTGSNGNIIKVDGTWSEEKVILRNCTIQSAKNGADLIKVTGGDIEIDSCRIYGASGSGASSAISASGVTTLLIDRALIENYSTTPAINYSGAGTFAISNSSVRKGGTGRAIQATSASGSIIVNTLFNSYFDTPNLLNINTNLNISGSNIYYANLTSLVPSTGRVTVSGGVALNTLDGNIIANTITSSNGVYGNLIGTASVADNALKLGGYLPQLYANLSLSNTFRKDITLERIDGDEPADLNINNGGRIFIHQEGYLESRGQVKVIGVGYFSGSGLGLSHLSASNWSPNSFANDVQKQLSGGNNITYDTGSGVIEFAGLTTASINSNLSGSGTEDDPISVSRNPSFTSVTASSGFSGKATSAYNADNADKLDDLDSSAFAKTGSSNIFTTNQTINGILTVNSRITASGGITGSFYGDGSQITNLTGSNWSLNGTSATASFYKDIRTAFTGDQGIDILENGDGRYVLKVNIGNAGIYADGNNIVGNGSSEQPFNLNTAITTSQITASVGFSGRLYDTASYAENSARLGGVISSSFARKDQDSNFTVAQTFTSISASSGISGSFKGNGSQLTNLTSSTWSGSTTGFFKDVQDAFVIGTGIVSSSVGGGRILLQADTTIDLKTKGSITGSGLTGNELTLKDTVTINDNLYVTNNLTSSYITASYISGTLIGTASVAINALNATNALTASILREDGNNYLPSQFVNTANPNIFSADQTVTGSIYVETRVSASQFTGSLKGQTINAAFITASNGFKGGSINATSITSSGGFSGDFVGGTIIATTISASDGISGSFSGSMVGGPVEVDIVSASIGITGSFSGSGALLNNLTGSGFRDFSGDIWSQLSGGTNIDISNGTSSLKDDIELTSVTASFSGSGAFLTDLTGASWDGGVAGFYHDVINTFVTGPGIYINNYGDGSGRYYITASGGGGGGGSTLFFNPDTISGSGDSPVTAYTVKPNLELNSITASFSGSGAKLSNLTGSNWSPNSFSTDVRNQLSAGSRLDYSNGNFNVKNNLNLNSVTADSLTGSLKSNLINATEITASGIYVNPTTVNNITVTYALEAESFPDSELYANLTEMNVFQSGNIFYGNGNTVNTFYSEVTGVESFYFDKNITVRGTASIGVLNTIIQESLQIGDKYITIISGSSTHEDVRGAGILWGSGSTDETTGDQNSIAYILYRSGSGPEDRNVFDKLEIFPGLNVSGSTTVTGSISSSVGFSGSTYYGDLFTGSLVRVSEISASNISGSQFTGSIFSGSLFTGSSIQIEEISSSAYLGDGSQLQNVLADSAKSTQITIVTENTLLEGRVVAISGTQLIYATNTNDRASNIIGIISSKSGNNYTITVSGIVSASNASSFDGGDIVYLGINGTLTNYNGIPTNNYITQVGIASFDCKTDGNIIYQPRVFGVKG